MAPFDRAYTTFYWSGIVSIALSCISSQINEIVVENRDFFISLALDAPISGPVGILPYRWNGTRGQSNLTKSASRGAHYPVRGHPRGSKFVPLNSWGRGSY